MGKITKLLVFCFLISNNLYAFSEEEREALHNKLKANHHPISYRQAREVLFSFVDNHDGVVCSVYSPSECQGYDEHPFKDKSKKKSFELYLINKEVPFNIEHTWPQSKGARVFPAKSDLHHLFVTNKFVNSKRSSFPFCEVDDIEWQYDGSSFGMDNNGKDCFEPPANHKGNVARAMLYFSVRYGHRLSPKKFELFKKWHLQDPVDSEELERNEKVKEVQGNSNIFVTDPDLF